MLVQPSISGLFSGSMSHNDHNRLYTSISKGELTADDLLRMIRSELYQYPDIPPFEVSEDLFMTGHKLDKCLPPKRFFKGYLLQELRHEIYSNHAVAAFYCGLKGSLFVTKADFKLD